MSVEGNWSIRVSTPLGERQSILSVRTDGKALIGTQAADGNSVEIFDGAMSGNDVSWKIKITDPMPMTLEFAGTVDGNEISGTVTLGEFGESSFAGIRS
jgi:hypothetical protein